MPTDDRAARLAAIRDIVDEGGPFGPSTADLRWLLAEVDRLEANAAENLAWGEGYKERCGEYVVALKAAQEREAQLREALAVAAEGWREANAYVSGYFRKKWDLDGRVDEVAKLLDAPAKCRGCGKPILPENFRVADGCPCNSPRGVNHGLVATNTCTCDACDPAQTGSTRYATETAAACKACLLTKETVDASGFCATCRVLRKGTDAPAKDGG